MTWLLRTEQAHTPEVVENHAVRGATMASVLLIEDAQGAGSNTNGARA
jgi:hypothetical protein